MKLLIIAGKTASGKTVALEQLCEKHNYEKLVTTTTREPRPGEIDKVHYHFISKDEFKKKLADNQFLEHVEHKGNFYGTTTDALNKDFKNNTPAIILEPVGTKNAKELLEKEGHTVLTAYVYEDTETCISRVRGRNATEDEIEERVNDLLNIEKSWDTYMKYDFQTKPLSSIEDNCSDIIKFVESTNQEPKNKRKTNRRNRP